MPSPRRPNPRRPDPRRPDPRRPDPRRLAATATALAAGVLLAACATPIDGAGRAAEPATTPEPATTSPYAADRAGLDEDQYVGLSVESHRLAAATAVLAPLVPEHPRPCSPAGGYSEPILVEADYFAPPVGAQLRDRGFVVAWVACRAATAEAYTLLMNLAFDDPAAASAARDELYATLATPDREATTLPGGDPAHLRFEGDGTEIAEGVAAEGNVVSFVVRAVPEGEGLASAQGIVDAQRPLSAGYTPTSFDQLTTLDRNPVGLQPLTLRVSDQGERRTTRTGPYDLAAYLHYAIDPVREREVLAANGFAGAFLRRHQTDTIDYDVLTMRFPSSRETNAAYETFADLASGIDPDRRPFTLPSIPEAPCFVIADINADGTFNQTCYVGFGSVLASVTVDGVAVADDVAEMDRLLPMQRDLIQGQ